MSNLRVVAAALLAAGLVASNSAHAITHGTPDCDDDGVTNCGNPNVVLLATYRHDARGGTVCSGTLLGRVSEYYLFLTAGHCTILWTQFIAQGFASSVGVSFDGKLNPIAVPPGTGVDKSQLAPGGVAVTHPEFRWGHWGENDYGIVSVPKDVVNAKWPNAPAVQVVVLPDEAGLSLDELIASTPKPQQNLKFSAVGYRLQERLNSGSNAGGPSTVGHLGTRRVAELLGFDNLRKRQLQTSTNPALGDEGTCVGGSGGPVLYTTTDGLVVQVGLMSWTDHVCRGTAKHSRTDIESFRAFIGCARENPGNVKLCGY